MRKSIIFVAIMIALILGGFGISTWAYGKGKNNKFFCKITGGRWVEKDTVYGDGLIKITESRGCHIKNSDMLNSLR